MNKETKIYAIGYKQNKTWLDRLIKLHGKIKGTGGKYSHCEILMVTDGVMQMASSSLPDGGVRVKPHVWDEVKWDYILLDKVTDVGKGYIERFLCDTNGKPYDTIAVIFTHLFPFRIQTNGSFFCSEWCLKALEYGDDAYLANPDDFMKIVQKKYSMGS